MKNIAIYASSSDALPAKYKEATIRLGKVLAQNGYNLVWGGGQVGLMGAVAESMQANGGKIYGFMPECLHQEWVTFKNADKMIFTKDLRERKAGIEKVADAIIALPGGFGTLEEVLEMITLKQIKLHQKPIIFFNINNFFAPLLKLFENIYKIKAAKESYRKLYYVTESPAAIITYLKNYSPPKLPDKWFRKSIKFS